MNNKSKYTKKQVLQRTLQDIEEFKFRHFSQVINHKNFSRYILVKYKIEKTRAIQQALNENLNNFQNQNNQAFKDQQAEYKQKALEILRKTTKTSKNGKEIEIRDNQLLVKHTFLASTIKLAYSRYKDLGLNEDPEICFEIEYNNTNVKMKKYADLINSTDNNSAITIIKLLGDDQERINLANRVDHTTKEDKVSSAALTLTAKEISDINKQLESDV